MTFTAMGACWSSGTNGATITITAAGLCTVIASQAGDASHTDATPVPQTFNVAQASQTVSLGPIPNHIYGDADFAVSATASSGLPVTFGVGATDNCTISGSTVHITGAGSCTATATQAGNANYLSASASQTFTVAQASQTISFGALPNRIYGDADFAVSGTASSDLPVTFGVGATDNCTISGSTVHITGAGSCTVTATQAGNANYLSASGSQTFTIAQASQTISFGPIPNHIYGDADFAVSATASSGLPVTFGVGATDSCTISGSTVHITGAGSCTVTATQTGNANYLSASASRTFTIQKALLTVTANSTSKVYGQPNPTFTAAFAGFVNGEGPGSLGGTLTFTTTTGTSSPPGTYPLTPSGLTSSNYAITFNPGTLTITSPRRGGAGPDRYRRSHRQRERLRQCRRPDLHRLQQRRSRHRRARLRILKGRHIGGRHRRGGRQYQRMLLAGAHPSRQPGVGSTGRARASDLHGRKLASSKRHDRGGRQLQRPDSRFQPRLLRGRHQRHRHHGRDAPARRLTSWTAAA